MDFGGFQGTFPEPIEGKKLQVLDKITKGPPKGYQFNYHEFHGWKIRWGRFLEGFQDKNLQITKGPPKGYQSNYFMVGKSVGFWRIRMEIPGGFSG